MHRGKELLLLDVGADPMEDLSARLRGLGYRVLRIKTVDEGLLRLAERRGEVASVLLPPDLPTLDLEQAVCALRVPARGAPLPLIVVGRKPAEEERVRLRRTGIEWALWRPIEDASLRFQINRALSGTRLRSPARLAERVPTDWPVQITLGLREKSCTVYSLSARGAYLATERPSLPRSLVSIPLPLPSGDVRVVGSVVMTNVPGNLARANLPTGMGVRFTGHSDEVRDAILAFTRERAHALRV
jgi:DNA-binding response OmpR family regulator